MTSDEIPQDWSRSFGLALIPLFEEGEAAAVGDHHVLLDGGYGTFALSTSDHELWREIETASWVWSSDIPHHVTITPSKVAVLRWDQPTDARVFDRSSVERSLQKFYEFLTNDRLRSTKSVVEHLLGFFRRVRSLAHAARIPDERTTDLFLAALSQLISPEEADNSPSIFGLPDDIAEIQRRLDPTGMSAALDEIRRGSGSLSSMMLHPALAVRHASGQLFQEAHFELLRASSALDLFGIIDDPEVVLKKRGGTHYTPPALARILVEQVLGEIPDLSSRSELAICDPACGSGAFLHEALRALRRFGFGGHLTIIGQDISNAAIAMARFVLSTSLRDWAPSGGFDLRLRAGDSLGELGIPPADVVVMNPPFVSFGAQTEQQRAQLTEAVGKSGTARGDLSMAFVVQALRALRANGVLGALFPASLLSSQAASSWRNNLASSGDIRLLASIGDFGLFTHAQVQVAGAVVRKGCPLPDSELTVLITGNDTRATGEAFRLLRKLETQPPFIPTIESEWGLFSVRNSALKDHPTWRFPSPTSERAIRALRDAQLPTIADLFNVRQGIQTGLNAALLLSQDQWQNLPAKERKYFKLATMSDSIENGKVSAPYRLFFPHDESGPLFESETALRSAMPTYFNLFLKPNRARLAERATIRSTNRSDWWGLMRPRQWSFSRKPRIISKFFSAEGGFAGDYRAEYLPVMGHVWLPKDKSKGTSDQAFGAVDVLAAYVALLNSSPFIKLLEIFSPHVAGGQFDLSWRHVAPIPMPNLRELSLDLDRGRLVSELADSGRNIDLANSSWRARNNQLVTTLYGAQIIADL